jgi:hypothetical protein
MRKFHSLTVAAAVFTAVAFTGPASAQATKKMTYEQAYTACKKELDTAGAPGVNVSAQARYNMGSGCMKKYGFRLKKKAKI